METNSHRETAKAWDEVALIYEQDEAKVITQLEQGNTSALSPREMPFLSGLCAGSHRAIHLQCSGGADALTLWKLGAQEIVGVDASPRMIASCRRKSEALGAPTSWYCCDVFDTPAALNETVDLVYTGKGALPWISDLSAWAQTIARLLKADGKLFLFEGHPLDWIWSASEAEFIFDPHDGHYFSDAILTHRWPRPFLDRMDLPEPKPKAREHQWTLGQIITSLIDAGLHLLRFEEYPETFWNHFPHMPKDTLERLPHTFSLLMAKG